MSERGVSVVGIAQANPRANYLVHKTEIDEAIARVLNGGHYILGSEVSACESEFASYAGVRHAIGVGSGSEALHLALRALGVGADHDVITVSHTAGATVAAIRMTGARPVFVDISEDSYTIDPDKIERATTPRTKAVVPVHLYGQAADLGPVLDVARRRGLAVVEDCAQAHGALYRGKKVGAWGNLGCFSFYPTKNLGALGDGGMVVTDDALLADRVRQLREYGWRVRQISETFGWNSRLDEIQAAVLRVKLRYLDEENQKRRELAELYSRELRCIGIACPMECGYGTHVYHLYVIRHHQRDKLRRWLENHGIATAIHYPVPVHLQPAFANLGYGVNSLPVTERICREILSLPVWPELSAADARSVVETILQFESSA